MNILGINAAYHESAACLLVDGQVEMAIEEERLNRIKHGKLSTPESAKNLPWKSIKICLDHAGITLEECDHIGYSFNPEILQAGVRTWRESNGNARTWPLDKTSYQTLDGGLNFAEGVLSSKTQLIEAGFTGQFHFLSHHACHAASAYHVSPFEKAAVLVVDGIGEWASTSLYYGEGKRIRKIGDFLFPNSLGFIWEKLSKYLGFSQYDASKVMGLAAFGDAEKTIDQFSKIVTDKKNLTVDMSVLRHESPDFSPLEELFELPQRTDPVDFGSENWQAYVNIAAGLQTLTEEVLVSLIKTFDLEKYSNLCMAGGVALNCAANGYIASQNLFKDIFVQPASNDGGTAMGAGFLVWNEILERERNYVFENAYLGPEYSDERIESILKLTKLRYEKVDITKVVAQLLAQGNIVGWFNGRMEWGPRALGNRSLLADPSNENIREVMNVKVKHRELFRPFCPSILEEKVDEWLVLEGNYDVNKFMLRTSMVQPGKAAKIPAVVHEDGTVRPQVVRKQDNSKYHQLISEFEAITGIPLLLNTSFNDSEPIVCSPQDAINTFIRTKIDYLALGSYLVSRPAEL